MLRHALDVFLGNERLVRLNLCVNAERLELLMNLVACYEHKRVHGIVT